MVITDVNQVTYNGDGINTAFPFTFRIIDATDIRLIRICENGLEVPLTSDYYVDTVNNTVYYPGYAPGSEPPEADQPPKLQYGEKLEIYRRLPITQEKDLGDKWPFYVIELALDKLTMLLQDIYGWIGRNEINKSGDGTHWEADGLPISNVGGPVNVDDVATKDYVDRILTGIILSGDAQIVAVDTVSQLRSADFEVGQVAVTLGYYDINDAGAGVYNIRNVELSDVDDGGATIILDNGNVAELIMGETLYFKQFGAVEDGVTDDTTAMQNAMAYAAAHNVSWVKCGGNVLIDQPINVKGNFEFDHIKYTGNDHAIVVDSLQNCFIRGNYINATAGSGIKITCTTQNCVQNHFDVRYIVAYVNGADILPVNGHGIMQNFYRFGEILATNGIGINSYIPANTGKYSWEGEDTFSVGICSSCQIGVNFEIEPVTGDMTDDGTITGITFLNLSCELSVTGIRIKCGKSGNPNRTSDSTIKGIVINNFRCRERDRSTMFLDAEGLLKDIYIYPTSSIALPQWKLLSSYKNDAHHCTVFAQIIDYDNIYELGRNLCSQNSITYIEEPTPRMIEIFGDTNFGDMCKKYKSAWVEGEETTERYDGFLYIPSLIYINSSINSSTITLPYHAYESAKSVLVSLAGGGKTTTLSFPRGGGISNVTETITNSTATRHLYEVQVYRYPYNSTTISHGTWRSYVRVRVIDLGEFAAF